MIFAWTVVGLGSILMCYTCYVLAKCTWEAHKSTKSIREHDKKRIEEIRYKRFTTGENSLTESDVLFEIHQKMLF